MEILHEDSDILVCYKEAGLAVQSAQLGKKDLVSMLKMYLWEQGGKRKEPYLGIVHRLDQPVEGILVFAKSPQAAGKLSSQLTDGRMKKVYQAVVRAGSKEIPETGCLKDYLLKDAGTNSSKVVPEGTKGAKLASLEYRVLRRMDLERKRNAGSEPTSDTGLDTGLVSDIGLLSDAALPIEIGLLEILLHTGRHHQIRVQMAQAGMPLLGDRKYGYSVGVENRFSGDQSGKCSEERKAGLFNNQKGKYGYFRDIRFPALCSVRISFAHPGTGKQVEFSCDPRGDAFEAFRIFSGQSFLKSE